MVQLGESQLSGDKNPTQFQLSSQVRTCKDTQTHHPCKLTQSNLPAALPLLQHYRQGVGPWPGEEHFISKQKKDLLWPASSSHAALAPLTLQAREKRSMTPDCRQVSHKEDPGAQVFPVNNRTVCPFLKEQCYPGIISAVYCRALANLSLKQPRYCLWGRRGNSLALEHYLTGQALRKCLFSYVQPRSKPTLAI